MSQFSSQKDPNVSLILPLCMSLSNPNLEQSKNDRVMEIVSVSLCRLFFSTCSLTFLTTKQKTVFLDICLIKPSDKKYDIYSYRITFTIRFYLYALY